MPPTALPREENIPETKLPVSLTADVISVIASFVPTRINDLRPLMLVNTTWYSGVVHQDGMKPKTGMYWPPCALQHRQPPSVTVTSVTANVVRLVCNALPQLQELVVDGPVRDPSALEQLTEMPKLTSLQFLTFYDRTASATIKRIGKFPQLTKLTMRNVDLKNTDLRSIAQSLPALQSLVIELPDRDPAVTEAGFKYVAENLKNLRELRLISTLNVTPRSVTYLGEGLKQLAVLDLSNTQTSGGTKQDQLEGIAHLNTNILEELSIGGAHGVSDEDLKRLNKFTALKILNLANCRDFGEDGGLVHLSNLKELQVLKMSVNISGCSGLANNESFKHVATNFPNLTTLDIGDTGMEANVVNYLAGLKHLQSLDFSGFEEISNAQLISIANSCPQLTTLNLKRHHMNSSGTHDEGIQHIAQKLLRMKTLQLEGLRISDDTIQKIADGMPILEELVFGIDPYGSTKQEGVTDVGMAHFSRMRNLKKLKFMRPDNITDDGLKHLRNLRKLTFMKYCPHVTDNGILHLVQNNPGLESLTFRNVTDTNAVYIAENLKFLKALKVRDQRTNALTAVGAQAILSMEQLSSLDFGCFLKDAGLEGLNDKLQYLREFGVDGRCYSSSWLTTFSHMETLKRLRIHESIFGGWDGNDALLRTDPFIKEEQGQGKKGLTLF